MIEVKITVSCDSPRCVSRSRPTQYKEKVPLNTALAYLEGMAPDGFRSFRDERGTPKILCTVCVDNKNIPEGWR